MGMKRLYIIANCSAGTGKAAGVWRETKALLQKMRVPYLAYQTKYEDHAMYLAEKISKKTGTEPIYMLVLGGDGTINEVLNGIRDFDRVRLGIIPTGSGNDFACNLKLPETPKESLREILRCIKKEEAGERLRRIDLGRVIWRDEKNGEYEKSGKHGKSGKYEKSGGFEMPEDDVCDPGDDSRIFGISSGLGIDALVCKKALTSKLKKALNKVHLGKLTYLILTLQSFFTMKTANVKMRTESEYRIFYRMIFAAAMNLRAEGGGIPMAPKASPTDGLLSLSTASDLNKAQVFLRMPLLALGRQDLIKNFEIHDGAGMELESDRPMVLHADGEYCGDVMHVRFQCLRGKLCLLHEL